MISLSAVCILMWDGELWQAKHGWKNNSNTMRSWWIHSCTCNCTVHGITSLWWAEPSYSCEYIDGIIFCATEMRSRSHYIDVKLQVVHVYFLAIQYNVGNMSNYIRIIHHMTNVTTNKNDVMQQWICFETYRHRILLLCY
jgi:hypothetical protein